MKLKSFLSTSWRALSLATAAALLAGSPGVATAATVAAPVSNDIFLGFRASGGQGFGTSYIVNLGQASQFTGASSSFILSTIGDIGADLAAQYSGGGSGNWYSRGDLFWGIFGTSTSTNPAVYASREQNPVGTSATPWPNLALVNRNATKSEILSVASGIGGYQGSDQTANSAVATFQTDSTNASSYNKQVTSGGTDFGSLSQWSSIEGIFGTGTSGTALDFFRINSSGTTAVGTFTINNSGQVTFTSAVPEPSRALLLLGGLVAAFGRRRRSVEIV
ncbi:MAG: PEP-CTERM sorting domain-containing protein [Roseimicrobium sp.]